jgi:hypothetical protein
MPVRRDRLRVCELAARKQEAAAARAEKRVNQPQVTRDEQLLQRLAAIGEYNVSEDEILATIFDAEGANSSEHRRLELVDAVSLTWESPAVFESEWTQPSLAFTVQKNDDDLRLVLDAISSMNRTAFALSR